MRTTPASNHRSRVVLASLMMLSMVAASTGLCKRACADEEQPPGTGDVEGDGVNLSVEVEVGSSELGWHEEWDKVSWVEYSVTAAALAGSFVAGDYIQHGERPGWVGGVLFDDEVRSHLAGSESMQRHADTISDIGLYGSLAWPFVDAAVAMIAYGDSEVAWQMTAMNIEVLAITNLFTSVAKMSVGRKRPDGSGCVAGDPNCNKEDRISSFWSGHTTMSFAGAGLTCAHHENLPLYGGGAGDVVACASATGLAALTGLMRIVADRHHTTDVMTGAGFGFAMGYFLPSVLHYWHDSTADFLPENTFIAPLAEQDSLGLAIVGTW